MNEATRAAVNVLVPVIANATREAVNGTSGMARPKAQAVVAKEVAAVVVNQTNQEPWYQSRVTWGAILAVASGIAGLAGWTLDVEDQAVLTNGIVGGISVIGGLVAWYGRWVAKKPIGQ